MYNKRERYRRGVFLSNCAKAIVTSLILFGLSFIIVLKIMKPSVDIEGISRHLSPAFTQDLINARLTGCSNEAITQYLSSKADASLRSAKVLPKGDFMLPSFPQEYGLVIRKPMRWRVYNAPVHALESPPSAPETDDEHHGMGYLNAYPYSLPSKNGINVPTYLMRNDEASQFSNADNSLEAARIPDAPQTRNAPFYYVIIPIEKTPYAVLLKRPTKGVPTLKFSSITLTLSGVFLLFVLGSFYLIGPRFRRVRRIENVCMQIANGNYSVRCNDNRLDSIGYLAQDINVMANAIEKNFDHQKGLLHAVSHELRTPLARLRFKIELLDIDENNEKDMARLESMDADFEEIDALLKELGYFNYLDSQKGKTLIENVSIEALLQETLKQRALQLDKLDVRIVGCHDDIIAQLDPTAFKRAIGNLLSNAARYAKNSIEIHVSLRHNPDAVEIAVEDDGPGIPPDKREIVFEPFVSIDKSRSKSLGGVGLGLAIVHRILRIHHGSVTIETSSLGGAKILTTWPVIHEPDDVLS